MVTSKTEYTCSVCWRRYSTEKEALACEQKDPYPLEFAIGDQCIIILSDGHKDNAYVCEITGMEVEKHHYIRLIKIIKQYSKPYTSGYRLRKEDLERHGPH